MKNLSLSTKVLLGVLFGILTGLFFGEEVAWMGIMGDIFIGLLANDRFTLYHVFSNSQYWEAFDGYWKKDHPLRTYFLVFTFEYWV